MKTLHFTNLPERNFNAIGIDRVCGDSFFLAPRGEKAGFFSEENDGAYSAKVFFPEKSERLFFVRSAHSSDKKIEISVQVAKNSKVIFVVSLSEKSHGKTDFSLKTEIAENAQFSLFVFHFSEGESAVRLQNILGGKNASGEIKTAFFGKKTAKNSISVESIAEGEGSSGDVAMRAALADSAFCEMSGMPLIEKHAKNAQNFLDQRALLFSPLAHIRALPQLSVKNDAIVARHRFSLARLFPEDLFYCASRGISESSAQKLLQKSLIFDMVMRIPDDALQETLTQFSENFFEKNGE